MKFKTLSDREIRLEILPANYPVRSREESKSNGQYLLGRLIRKVYGFGALILEEFPIPEERLWIDFFMPHHKLAFEYQGEQHDKFNKFFHGDKQGYEKSVARDQRKRFWCEVNDIVLVEVRGQVTIDDLMNLITEARESDDE